MWGHCPGNLNPADLPSRGTSATDFYNLFSEWNNGKRTLIIVNTVQPIAYFVLQHLHCVLFHF